MKRVWQLIDWIFLLPVPLIGAGWLLGAVLRDREGVMIWFYFIPAPAVVALSILWFVFTKRTVRRTIRKAVAIIGLIALAKILFIDMRWHFPRPVGADYFRLVHWNAAHEAFGFKPVLRVVQVDHPDVVLLSEAFNAQDLGRFAEKELGLPYIHQEQGMALLSRYPLRTGSPIPIVNGNAWWIRIDTPRGALDVAAVDLFSHPTLNRRLPIDHVAAWASTHEASVPLMIIGDFNTPRDARVFGSLRTHFRNAYETSGHAWPYSWPLPVPVYSLDHTWYSTNVAVRNYCLRASRLSDHLRQVMDVSLAP